MKAGQGKVVEDSRPAVLTGNDVINGEGNGRVGPLRDLAILAPVAGPVADRLGELFVHRGQRRAFALTARRALDWSSASKCPARTYPLSSSRSTSDKLPSWLRAARS